MVAVETTQQEESESPDFLASSQNGQDLEGKSILRKPDASDTESEKADKEEADVYTPSGEENSSDDNSSSEEENQSGSAPGPKKKRKLDLDPYPIAALAVSKVLGDGKHRSCLKRHSKHLYF